MDSNIPKIFTYPRRKCEKHQNIYTHLHLPCPYSECINGINSEKFVDVTLPNFHHIYTRKNWNGINGDTKYLWVQEDEPLFFNGNIIYDELFKFVQNKSSENIYHYTSIDALYKILESNELWLTEWKCTNDSSEIKHGLELAHKFNKSQLDLESVINKNNYFIASFSYELNKVTLFDRYADNAKGIAIEFDTNFYNNARESFWYKNLEFTKLMPVIYDEKTQKKILEYSFYIYEVSKQWLFESKDFYTHENKLISKKKREKLIEKYFLTTLEEIISFFKHPSFEDERETRWLFRYDKKFIKEHKFDTIEIKSFNKKNYFTSTDVFNMTFEKAYNFQKSKDKIKLPIKSIILGSRVQNKEQVIDKIKEQCKKFGFENIEINISNLPYR